jgi:hypothetical protein
MQYYINRSQATGRIKIYRYVFGFLFVKEWDNPDTAMGTCQKLG